MVEKKVASRECMLAFLLRTVFICLKTRIAQISRFLIGRSSQLIRQWLYMTTMKSNLAVCSCALKRHNCRGAINRTLSITLPSASVRLGMVGMALFTFDVKSSYRMEVPMVGMGE